MGDHVKEGGEDEGLFSSFEESNGTSVIACIFFRRSFASTRSFTVALNTSLWKKTPSLGVCPHPPPSRFTRRAFGRSYLASVDTSSRTVIMNRENG